MRSEFDVNNTITEYADMVHRICMCHVKNQHDMEDLFQNIFVKYMTFDGEFESEEHKKAWLIRVAVNACKDYQRVNFWKRAQTLDALQNMTAGEQSENREILHAVLELPDKYKDAIYLHYYEGYSAAEIGKMLGKKENTIYSLLSRGRNILRKKLGGGIDE